MCGKQVILGKSKDKSSASLPAENILPDKAGHKPAVKGAIAVFGFLIYISLPLTFFVLISEIVTLTTLDMGYLEEIVPGFLIFVVAELAAITFRVILLAYSLYLLCKLNKNLPQKFLLLGVMLTMIEAITLAALYSLSSSDPEGMQLINELQLEAPNPLATFLYVAFWSLVLRYTQSGKRNLVK